MKQKREPKTPKEIRREIKRLKALKNILDVDWLKIIAAQIRVLTDNLNKEQILDEFEGPETPEHALSLILYAREWLDGTADSIILLREIGFYRSLIDFEDEFKNELVDIINSENKTERVTE